MSNRRILLCLNHLGGEELKYVLKAFEDNWIVPMGPDVDAFEHDLEAFANHRAAGEPLDKRVVALCNGTSAVQLALIGCGVKPGDEVVAQSFTFCASVNPIMYLGAKPVLVDSEPDSWNMDPELLDHAIADRIAVTGRKPRAIMAVHLYGMPARIDEILAVGRKYGIPVIEDAAEAMGSNFDGQRCGTFGRYGVLSFNGNKMITTSGGGALITPDDAARRHMMFYATQARESYPYYQHEELGYNFRLSNVCAAIGRGQMAIIDEHLAHHRHAQDMYRELLADIPGVHLHENPSARYDANFWLCTITLDDEVRVRGREKAYQAVITGAVGGAAGVTHCASSPHTAVEPRVDVEALRLALAEAGIESRPLWKPMHCQPLYADAPRYVNGVSEDLFSRGLCLPAGPWVTDDDLRYIAAHIRQAIISI